MKLLKTHPHFSDEELQKILKKQKTPRAFSDWQIIYSVQTNYGKQAKEFASILGVKRSKIHHVIQQYNKHGKSWRTHDNWGGRREERCFLTFKQEAELLNELEREAVSGKILIYKHAQKAIERKIGHAVSDDYVWDLFNRHGWKKKAPRQSHPKANREKQEDFKKKLKKNMGTASKKFTNKKDKRPIKLFFQDEARFGRIDNITSCWVPRKQRAKVGNQIIREYTYAYSALCPETGEHYSLILPYANGICMQTFIEYFSEEFKHYRVVMAMDRASWHLKDLVVRENNIVPLFQPPYSPELNPVEHLWHHIREKGRFKNKTFGSLDEVEEVLEKQLKILDKNTIKNMSRFSWIKNVL